MVDLVQALTKHWLHLARLPSPSRRHLSSLEIESEQKTELQQD